MSESPLKQNKIVPIEKLVPHPRNYRQHPETQVSKLVSSLIRFGQGRSIVCQDGPQGYLIVAGHGIVEAAKKLQYTELRADILPADWTPEQVEGYLVADNMHSQDAQDDESALAALLQEQQDAGYDLTSLGTDDEYLRQLLEGLGDEYLDGESEGEDEEDEEETEIDPDSIEIRCQSGEIWQLGEHRLLVGDCTNADNLKRLMQGQKAALVVTSPPYTDQREYGLGAFDWDTLMYGAFEQIIANVENDAHILINLGLSHKNRQVDMYWDEWLASCSKVGWPLFGWYVWDKLYPRPHENNGRLLVCHEFLFHFNNKTRPCNKWIDTLEESQQLARSRKHFNREKDGSLAAANSPDKFGQLTRVPHSVIPISSEQSRGIHTQNHPAVYPVALPEFAMKTWSSEDDIVYEPFCGSGTTIIAAENLNRRCFACEIDVKYASVILARWEQLTGQQATLLERVEEAAHAQK